MLELPRLKYNLHAEFIDDEKVLLLSGKDGVLLNGELYTLVLANLETEGTPINRLISRLKGKASEAEIIFALNTLEKEGYITEASPSIPTELCAYWNNLGMDVTSLYRVLAEKSISIDVIIDVIGAISADVIPEAFASNGIRIDENDKHSALKVIFTDDYERLAFREINRRAMETQQPWMLVKPTGGELWIGPIFRPGITGCWECLKHRLNNNRKMNVFYKSQKNTHEPPPVPPALSPMSLQISLNLCILEIVKWLYHGTNESLEGKLVSLDTSSFNSRSHVLVKRPQCPVCGENEYRNPQPEPAILQRKNSCCVNKQGGYRDVTFAETVEKYKHHVSPITGIVSTLEPYLPETGSPVFNFSAGHNVALKSKTLLWLNHHLRSVNVGKGRTWMQAKASALCEAIERYSCTYQGNEPYITGNFKQLGPAAIHPNRCMNYSDDQYMNRDKINETCSKFYSMIPVPFDESQDMHWTPLYSLTQQDFKYLPSCFCYPQYPVKDERNLFCYPDTNGNAAGNSPEEAILQSFLELIERDSIALWWYNRLQKPAVDLAGFNDPYFNRLEEYYKSLNRNIYVLDITSDLGIPAFAAVSYRLNDDKPEIIFGFGAHVEAKIAVDRALTELNQMLPVVNIPDSLRSAGEYRVKDPSFLHWLSTATLENHPYFLPLENIPSKKAADYSMLCNPNVYDSLNFCVGLAAKNGLETLVLDMTRPDAGLHVVKVVVPGLRHFWRRLAPGRLYDVPVKMGWLKKTLKEEELNPIGIFV